jgi:hypothetical protein
VVVEKTTPQSARYWRLRFGQGRAPKLTGVEGETTSSAERAPGVVLQMVSGRDSNGLTYTLPTSQPIARVRITPRTENTVLPLVVEGREQDAQPWQFLAHAMVFRLNSSAGEQHSDPVAIGGRALKAIRLRRIEAAIRDSSLSVEIEREPVVLVVNARGAGPFLLAWGSRAAEDTSLPFRTLVPTVKEENAFVIEEGRVRERRTLGGDSRLTALAPAERAARWQTMLVWGLLVAGAGALGLLAFRVWRESRMPT